MNFIFTKYVHPIEAPITISEKLNFTLDNPRTEEEIEVVLLHIKKTLENPTEINIILNNYINTKYIEWLINELRNEYSENDLYAKEFFKKFSDNNFLKTLAAMWIIARFDDEGELEKLRKPENKGWFITLEEKNPIIVNCANLVNYCYLLSLIIHDDFDFYEGRSFLLQHSSEELQFIEANRILNDVIVQLPSYGEYTSEEVFWKSFFHIKEELIKTSKKIDEVIDENNMEKILDVGNLLKVVNCEIKDYRYKLVTLVSIIELLLTHSPDFRRFNIEDSISKQFKLKASILIYQNDKTKDLAWIKKRLRDIYNQRSNIAHGNFKNLKKYLENEAKNSDFENPLVFDEMVFDLYTFIRAILEEYIKDKIFVEFLKEN